MCTCDFIQDGTLSSHAMSLCATGQNFHRELLSLYVDNQLAEDYFSGGRTAIRAIGPKTKKIIVLMY